MPIFNEITFFLWLIFIVYWIIAAASAKKTIRRGFWWKGFALRVCLLFVIVIIFHTQIAEWAHSQNVVMPTNPLIDIIGVLFVAIGIAFAIWARVHLGRNWGMPMSQKKEPELVTSGPYAYVRHPIYTGVLLAILGSVLVSGFFWLLVFVVAGIYFMISAFTEEKNMQQIFPSQYPSYKKRTKMLIPFVF